MTTINFVSTASPAVDEDSDTTIPLAPLDLPNSAGFARTNWEARYVRLLVLLDIAVGALAAGVALLLRFGSSLGESYNRDYLWFTLALPLAWLAALSIYRAFEPRYLFVGNDEYERVFRAGVGLTAALAIISFTFDMRLARGYVVIAMPLAILASLSVRYLTRRRLHASWACGQRLRRVILVGHEQAAYETARQLRRERYHGMGVVGVCLPRVAAAGRAPAPPGPAPAIPVPPGAAVPPPATVARLPGLPPVYGDFDEVAQAVQRAHADTVIVLSCPELSGTALRRLAWKLERDDIDLILASTLVDVAGDRTTIRPVDGLPLLHVEHPRLRGVRRVLKDVTDRVAALTALLAFSPVLAAIALLIKTTPGREGPVVFRQTRVGRNGRPFTMLKFRSMYPDAEARLAELRHLNETGGTLFKMRNDPRVTPAGRWLRKFSLDEVPQLFNVLRGDMSLVGPRPPLPDEVAEYPFDMRRRLVVKPGLTGLWQVSGRSDLSWEESIRLDLQYVENWSFAMDLMILARTVFAVWRSAGAY